MKRFYTNLFFVAFIFFSASLFSQEKELLPKGLSNSESQLISEFEFRSSVVTPAPSTPVRTPAEWEEVEYLLVSWVSSFQNILQQIVAAGVKECKVLIVTQNENSVRNYLISKGIDLTNVEFLNEDADSIWIRDYAGNTIYANDIGERGLTDWIYNRPRPNDDVIPSSYADLLNIPIYLTNSDENDLVNTGGNFMSDGLGNGFSSSLVLEENEVGNPYGVSPKTEAQIDAIMYDYMGVDNYIKMDKLQYDQIHHIDMHMKLLDEETLLVSRYPEGVADGPQINENIEYVLENFKSHFGTPYDVKWIDAPPSPSGNYPDNGGYYRTYSNALFLNKSILVPTYREAYDVDALAYYEELMPGYNIVGIDVDNADENLISQVGAIHCITHSIGVEYPLWIVHQPLKEAIDQLSITSMIKHATGIKDASVFWKTEEETNFTETKMINNADIWSVDISIPSDASKVNYYIRAEANSGKTINRPIVAPQGFWTVDVDTVLSAQEWAEQNISSAYPNPARDRIHFKLNSIKGNIQVEIHNMLGQKMFEQALNVGNGHIELALKSSWKGTLFVSFIGDFGKVTKKIIKI